MIEIAGRLCGQSRVHSRFGPSHNPPHPKALCPADGAQSADSFNSNRPRLFTDKAANDAGLVLGTWLERDGARRRRVVSC